MAELQTLNLKLLPNSGYPKIALGGNVTLFPRNGIKTHQVSGWFFRFIIHNYSTNNGKLQWVLLQCVLHVKKWCFHTMDDQCEINDQPWL
jgi:hypothetical protein